MTGPRVKSRHVGIPRSPELYILYSRVLEYACLLRDSTILAALLKAFFRRRLWLPVMAEEAASVDVMAYVGTAKSAALGLLPDSVCSASGEPLADRSCLDWPCATHCEKLPRLGPMN